MQIQLDIASIHMRHFRQFDIDNTFFRGDVSKNVYIRFSHRTILSTHDNIYKLTKSLCGFKQTCRQCINTTFNSPNW